MPPARAPRDSVGDAESASRFHSRSHLAAASAGGGREFVNKSPKAFFVRNRIDLSQNQC
jgi:hypothetical protein